MAVAAAGGASVSRGALLLRGWGLNAFNPKGTLFLLAVLPQFIDASAPLLPQYTVIAATFGGLLVAAGTALARFRRA